MREIRPHCQAGDFIREVPEERWSAAAYWQPGVPSPGKTPSKWGGFIDELPFDPVEFGIPPTSVAAVEPAQLLALETARKALVDAGYLDRWFDREKTAVIFGAEGGMELSQQYAFRNLYTHYMGAELPDALAQSLPVLTEDSFAGVLGNVISGRIANRLGLGGVNYAVDSACASSLTAIELGVKELRGGSSDMVLAGGADFHNGIADFLMFASVGALSPKGRCRPFDNQADGISLGEGVGVLVMKRLSDAERDGDRIYAVIDAVAGSSDGKALGLTAPRREGQRRALDRAYWQAGVLPSEIGLMEAHGTGTVVGDRTELETLTEVFTAGGAVPGQTQLGSVKSQIGHTKCAAGIAGVIKVAKALHHRVLPATQQITTPNAAFHSSDSPFRLGRKATPWVAPGNEKPRAAVSAFGFGGTNFHAVLSAYPANDHDNGAVAFPAELFAFRGSDRASADATLVRLQRFLAESDAPLQMRDLAHSAWAAKDGPVQVAFVAKDRSDLSRSIAAALGGNGEGAIHRRVALDLKTDGPAGVAALFGGQGSQYPNMLADLFVYFPGWLQDLLAAGESVLPTLYPPTAYDEPTRQLQERALADTRNAQPALGLVESAAFRWLSRLGLRPDMAAGHSYGELVALACAGAFDFADLMRLSRARAQAMAGSVTGDAGLMAAVRLDAVALEPLLADFPTVVIANRNSPIQSVIAGPSADVRAACAFLTKQSVGLKVLDTDRAFHSPLMAKSRQRFAEALAIQPIATPRCVDFGLRSCTVVGVFAAGNSGFDSEIWGDAEQMMQAYRRQAYSSLVVGLRDSETFDLFAQALAGQPRMGVEIKRESKFYADQSEALARFISILGQTISAIFSVGAIIGAMITMYASVASRTREIGTLRALGFRRSNILTAFLQEAVLLGFFSGVVGLAAAASLQRMEISTTNIQTFSEVVFRLTLTPGIAVQVLLFSVFMGTLGGLLPANRACRLEIVDALRN